MLPTQPTVETIDVSEDELADIEVVDAEIVDPGDPTGQDLHPVDDGPLSETQARELTQQIRAATDVLWSLVARAHAGRAWRSLGYASWEQYVAEEFNMSRSRSYQLLDHARVVSAIEAAAPVGTQVSMNERAARELKAHLDEVTDKVASATNGMTPQEAQDTIDQVLADFRKDVAAHDAATDDPGTTDTPWGTPDGDFYSLTGVGGAAGSAFDDLAPAVPADGTNPPPAPAGPNAEETRRMFQKVFELYSALDSLGSMPDVDAVIAAIPVERVAQVSADLPVAMEWLHWFAENWQARIDLAEAS